MGTLNLGILAHVDAGKTTLTERLLHAAGIIDEVGSVDDGSTQTDSLALERQRGITIKSAVVSFVIDGVTVNLIDTPGHPDFIAEVERALSLLDGAVLVVSAVEGVQAQARVLMRTLRRLNIPTLIFANKIDRSGARYKSLLRDISEKLTPAIIPMGSVSGLGTGGALCKPYGDADADFASGMVDLLADRDDALLAEYVDDDTKISYRRLRRELAAQTGRAWVHPVFFGSAIRLGDHGRGCGFVDGRHHGVAARGQRRPRRPHLGRGLQGRTESGRGEDRVRPHVLGNSTNAGSAAIQPGQREEGHGNQRFRPRPGRPEYVGRRGADRKALGPGRRADR
jgi:small GTP-binding protein